MSTIVVFSRKAPRQAKRPDHGPRSRALTIMLIALLAIAAFSLTILAVLAQRPGEAPRQPEQPPMFETPQTAPPPATEEPPAEALPPAAVAPQRVLAVGAEPGHLLRSTAGACGADPSAMQVSFDQGESWDDASLNDLPGAIVRQVDASDGAIARLAYLDEACALQFARSYVGGTDWEPDTAAGASLWYIGHDPSAEVQAPAGAAALPCTAVAISGAGSRGIALCDDASVTVSENSGETWTAPLPVPGAAAVGLTSDAFVVASAGEAECTGVRTRTLAGNTLSEPGACLDAAAHPGQLAVAADTGFLYLWAGESFARSNDGGQTW